MMPEKIKLTLFFSGMFCTNNLFASEESKLLTPVDSLLPMLSGLLVILAVIFVLAFLFKKFSNFGLASKNIKIMESQIVGNKEKLMIVQVQNQQFLIGVTSHVISPLGELTEAITEQKSKKETENKSGGIVANTSFSKIISQLINSTSQPILSTKELEPRDSKR